MTSDAELAGKSMTGRFLGIRLKIVVPFVLLFLLCLLLVGSIAVGQVTRTVEKRLNPEQIGELVSRAGFPLNRSSLNRIREIIGCEMISVSADSKVLATTFNDRKVVDEFMLSNTGLKPGSSGWVKGLPGDSDYYIVYHGVSSDNPDPARPSGLIMAIPGSVVRTEKAKTVKPIIIAALVGTVFIILVGLYIAHTITRPVRNFARFAGEIQAGGLDRRIEIESRDEIRDLADAFNAMLERLRDSEKQLVEREKMAAIGSIATGMAHEIRNPLSSIRMTVQLMLRRTEDGRMRSDLEMILREIERLSYTLSELLIFARPPMPNRTRTELKRLTDETVAVLRPQLEHHDISVEIKEEPGLPEVYVDQNQFKQVMMNLVINAIEAMPSGGIIGISFSFKDENVIICVRNSGDPVPAELGDRIFDAFFSTKAGGSGLGLAVTQIIVHLHGGVISYSSDAEKGTEFVISIPAGSQETASSAADGEE